MFKLYDSTAKHTDASRPYITYVILKHLEVKAKHPFFFVSSAIKVIFTVTILKETASSSQEVDYNIADNPPSLPLFFSWNLKTNVHTRRNFCLWNLTLFIYCSDIKLENTLWSEEQNVNKRRGHSQMRLTRPGWNESCQTHFTCV